MKNKNISRACLVAALFVAGTVSVHASALPAGSVEAAPLIMDNTRMAKPKAKPVKQYAPTNRPAEAERLFKSQAVEAEIARVKQVLTNAKLAWMFENCFPNTLDTTVRYRQDDNGKDDTVVYTGDIHAMWLRDSGAQVWPYLRLANKDEHLRKMLASSNASSSIPTPMPSSIPTIRIPTTSGWATRPRCAPNCMSASGKSTRSAIRCAWPMNTG